MVSSASQTVEDHWEWLPTVQDGRSDGTEEICPQCVFAFRL
jgi:hypothetical protein